MTRAVANSLSGSGVRRVLNKTSGVYNFDAGVNELFYIRVIHATVPANFQRWLQLFELGDFIEQVHVGVAATLMAKISRKY